MALDHWNRHATQWGHVGPPLRPSSQDIALLETRVRELGSPGLTVLLGVTPEIASMNWPDATRLLAVDRCSGMVQGVWPCTDSTNRQAVCGDWFNLPVQRSACRLVVGDGCFTLLDYTDGYRRLLTEAHHALAEEGIFMMRYFCRPQESEPLSQVIADLRSARIGNFHVLKWRLAMALHGTIEEGVSVGAIWQAFDAAVSDRDALTRDLGWPRASIDTIDAYQGVTTPYTFPTLSEIRAATEELFEEISIDTLDYELGDRCPLICYRKRN